MKIYGVIMAGGSGTRFWPLSRRKMPKQFLNITGEKSMIKMTMDRLSPVIEPEAVFVVTGRDMVAATREALGESIGADRILAEPAARNTAACIGYAAMEILRKHGDGIMCIFASDHYIKDEDGFRRVLGEAVKLADEGSLITIGIKPTYPATGYGYIKRESQQSSKVLSFVEKPDADRAKEYLESGSYLWNSGMFVWKASVIMEKFRELLPEVYEPLKVIGDAMGTSAEQETIERIYPEIPRISVDYGIMEKASDILVVEGDFGWSDVGSLDALGDLYEHDEDGNAVRGTAALMDSEGCIVKGEPGKLMALIGVSDLMVIDTKDVVLVCPKDRAQDVKRLIEDPEGGLREDFL